MGVLPLGSMYILKKFFFFNLYLNYFLQFYKLINNKIFFLLLIFIIIGIIESIGISLFSPIIDSINNNETKNTNSLFFQIFNYFDIPFELFHILFIIIFIFILKGIILLYGKYFQSKIQAELHKNFLEKIIQSIVKKSYTKFIKTPVSYNINLLNIEAERASGSFISFCNATYNILFSIPLLIAVTILYPIISIFGVSLSLIGYILLRSFTNKTKKISQEITQNNFFFNSLTIQLIENFGYFKATNTLALLQKKSLEKIDILKNKKIKIGLYSSIIFSSVEPFAIIILSLVIFFSYYLNLQFSSVILSLIFFYRIIRSILEYQKWWQNFNVNIGGLEVILDNIDYTKIENINQKLIIKNLDNIKFNNFSLELNNNKIFNNINVDLKSNNTIGLKGRSGSGKTTFLNTICGLIDTGDNSFLINDNNSKDINFEKFRNNISLIPQYPVIFNDTVRNNIALWDNSITDNAIKLELKKFNLNNLDLNYVIDDKGKNLSGGQLQRINIIREVIKNREIIIFDEPTSSLDYDNKQLIKKLISDLKNKKTIIITSHDEDLLQICDIVYEIKNKNIYKI